MNLSDLFQYGGNKNNIQNMESHKPTGSVSLSGNSQSQQMLKGLLPGQSLQGEIISKNGNEVQILVDKDIVITAKLDKGISASVGQNMTFEVRNNSGTQIALRPLYENLTQDTNVLKALEAARLPMTDEWTRLVSSMMKQGMSIDKNALQDMGKLFMANPLAKPETIVALQSMQIPVTPENIEQYERYQNYEHQIVNNVSDILSQMPEAFHSMIQTGHIGEAIDFYTQILQLFSDNSIKGIQEGQTVFRDILPEAGETMPQEGEAALKAEETALKDISAAVRENVANGIQSHSIQQTAETVLGIIDRTGVDMENLNQNLTGNQREVLAGLLGKLGFSQEYLAMVETGNISAKQLLSDICILLESNSIGTNRENVVNLLGSKAFGQLLNNEILQQWLIKPMEVGTKSKIEEFYDKLKEQTGRLTETLSQIVKDTPLAKSLTVMQNNIDFIHHMNQAFNYIQLPLKMSGGNAHGDLYVYTNRKNSLKEDGSVSALLHLDMEHLGTMDIHVTMKEKNVGTKFYLKEESLIDFVAGNIHILNDRLAKRGYSIKAEVLVKEETDRDAIHPLHIDSAEEIEKKDNLLAQYSFDVRA